MTREVRKKITRWCAVGGARDEDGNAVFARLKPFLQGARGPPRRPKRRAPQREEIRRKRDDGARLFAPACARPIFLCARLSAPVVYSRPQHLSFVLGANEKMGALQGIELKF